jgi:O-antigen/teichoic acid export membrane protein
VNAALSYRLISLVFDRDAAELGARAMCVLALGLGAFAIFGLFTTVLTSLRQERTSALLTVAALVLVLGLCSALLHAESLGEPMLLRTAVATSAGLFAATLTAARSVHRRVGAVVSIVTVIRVATCAAIAIAAGRTLATLVSPSRVWTVGLAAVVAVIYLAALVVARELGRADLQLVLATARRRSS